MRHLGIDPGTHMGWASDMDGTLRWGELDLSMSKVSTEGLRWLRFTRWLDSQLRGIGPAEIVIGYEAQYNFDRSNPMSSDVGKITTAFLLEYCEKRRIACEEVHAQAIKAFAIPKVKRVKGDPKLDRSKDAMIRAAKSRLMRPDGVRLADGMIVQNGIPIQSQPWYENMQEHEADALHIYWLMCEKFPEE